MFGLGCSALPFVPPDLCGAIAMLVSAFGGALALAGLLWQRTGPWPKALIVSLVLNVLVLLLGFAVSRSDTHVIDRFEHGAPWVLGLICFAPFAGLVLALVAMIWGTFGRD